MTQTAHPAGHAPHVALAPWARLKAALLDLLYPPRCAGCDSREAWFCAQCVDQLARAASPCCSLCGEPMPAPVRSTRTSLCPRCQAHPLALDGLRFVAYFEGPLRRAVHQLKYRGCRAVAPALGHLMADAFLADSPPCELLVPVPLHARRLRERGYNQAALLAQAVGAELVVPVHTTALVRCRETRSQVKLNASERRENVRRAFTVPPAVAETIRERAVVVVDDVCTTGATLEACAMALRQAGARSVWGLTLGRER